MQWYKRVIIFFSLALLVMPVLSSCVNDNLVDDIISGQQKTGNRYVYFKIETADNVTSRADSGDLEKDEDENHGSGDLVNGQDPEHAIGLTGNFCLFFNAAGNLTQILALELATVDDPVDDPVDGEQHVREAVYGTKLEVDEDEVFPKSCLVILNGQTLYTKLSQSIGKSVEEVLELMWEDENPWNIGKNESGFLTMSSSIYLDGTTKKSTVDITADNLQEEGTYDPKKVIIVHVERMTAKFSFRISKAAEKVIDNDIRIFQPSLTPDIVLFDGFDDNEALKYLARKWRVKVTGWNINAYETQSNIFKRFNQNGNYFMNWNDPANFRTYWSEDPHYMDSDYPWQYRRSDNFKLTSYAVDGSVLKNYSFNDLNLDGSDGTETNVFDKHVYVPENTFDAASVEGKLDDREELLAGTHLLVGAELQIEQVPDDPGSQAGETDPYYAAVDIYRDRSGFYYLTERECVAALLHSFNQSLESQMSMEYTFYNWSGTDDNENMVGKRYVAVPSGLYRLSYVSSSGSNDWKQFKGSDVLKNVLLKDWEGPMMPPGTIRNGDGRRLPWLYDTNAQVDWIDSGLLSIRSTVDWAELPIYAMEDIAVSGKVKDGAVPIRYATADDIKSLIYEWAGSVEHFDDGKMYYASGVDNPTLAESSPERYGVVRNNWYQFNLTDVKNFGVPVDNPDQPIVPGRNGANDQLNVTIWLLGWHTVQTTTPGF